MRDGLAARHLAFRPLDIDMNPLVVACGIGELVDLLLGYRVPVAGADLLARIGQQIGPAFDFKHRGAPLFCWQPSTLSRRSPGSACQALLRGSVWVPAFAGTTEKGIMAACRICSRRGYAIFRRGGRIRPPACGCRAGR